ncbi:hypothetical protein [Gemmobacter serpentinus]|uniref:hypothetical protein n=1 Tax=Gemmobacter serpentinus TaxID=2652247 RepID=UPI00124D4272|nr:hypothetical protein [Gemmobacter serpentinus]
MGQKLLIAAVAAISFRRCGRTFPKEGVVVDYPDDFSEEEWGVLRAEPMLHISVAPEEAEIAADAANDLKAQLRRVVAGLASEDFGEDGAPLAEAIRKALPGTSGITKKLVAEVWAELKDQQP